jgi:hypothetical protein
MNRLAGISFAGLSLLSLICLVGCGGATPDSATSKSNKTNIQRLGNMYQMFQFKHKFRGPEDEAEFKEFLKGVAPSILEPRGIDPNDIDSLFICERDNEPFQIRYNVPTSTRGSTEAVIFENTGNGGPRMVGFLNMVQREVAAEEYNQLLNAKPPKIK